MAHPQDAADTPDEFGVLSSGGGVSSLKSRFEQLSAGHVGGHSLPSSHHPHSRHFHFPPTGKGTWSARSEAAQVGEDGATSDEAGPSGTHTLPSRLGRHHGGTIHQSLHWHRPTTHATHHSSGGASDSALDPPPSVTADIFASPDELPGTRPSLTRTVTDGNPFSPDPSPHAEAVVSDSPFVPTGQVDLAGSDVGSTGSGEGRDGTRAPPPRPPKNFLVATRGQVTPVASSSRSVVSVAGRKPPPPPIPPSHRKGYSYPETGAIGSADAPESQATVSSIRSRFDIQPNAEASSSFRSNGPSTNARPLSFEARQSFLKGQPPSPQTRPALAVPPRSPALPAADLHSQLDDRSVELLTRNSPSPLPDSDASSVGSRGEAGSGRPVVPPRPPIRNEVFAATMPEVPTTSTTTSSAYGTCPPPLPSRVRGDPFEEASPPPSLSSMPLESSRSIGSLPPGKPPAHPASIGRSKLSPAVVGSAPPRLPVRKANPGSVSPSRSPRTLPPPLRTANTTRTTGAAPIAAPPVRVVNHADTQPPPLNLPPPQRHPHQAQSLPVPVPASSEPRASSIPSHIQPPPPMRTAGSDAKMPPRRAVRDDADSSSSSGDDDEPGIGHSSSSHSGSSSRGPLSKSAPSSLGTPRHRNTAIFADELPDGTHVNRRPPSFVPDCVASAKSPFQTFAVAGHTIVTGSHDKCKVYRVGGMAHSGEKVCVVAEHGPSRETRVTALAFRPPCPSPAEQQLGARIPDDRLPGEAEEEGRYVWCGTREGHVWELDTLEGCIVESRNNVHSGPVTHIVRVGDRMLSLDEGGKVSARLFMRFLNIPAYQTDRDGCIRVQQMSIWLPSKGPGTAYTGVHLTGQPHTQRISLDKSAYALVLGEQLWVCTGPASHETKHGTGKGPRIRIYNPFTDDRPFNATSKPVSMPPEMAIGVGPVSSGTIIPTKAELAYLGHESGHVSIIVLSERCDASAGQRAEPLLPTCRSRSGLVQRTRV